MIELKIDGATVSKMEDVGFAKWLRERRSELKLVTEIDGTRIFTAKTNTEGKIEIFRGAKRIAVIECGRF